MKASTVIGSSIFATRGEEQPKFVGGMSASIIICELLFMFRILNEHDSIEFDCNVCDYVN